MSLAPNAASGANGGHAARYSRGVNLAVCNPELGLLELDRADSEESLIGFIRSFWNVLEPGRKMVEGWALEAICDHLEAVHRGDIRKLLINVPPGCMKSMSTCVFFPAWEWGPMKRPDLRYICASYTQDLTVRDNRRCRQVVADNRYRQLWGGHAEIAGDQDAKVKFETTARGWKIATSVGGAVVGERADRFIIDDPHNIKTAESTRIRESTLQWFTEVVPTRVNDPEKATFIIIMQRVHERDISGLILATELGYEHLCLPMEFEEDHPHPSRSSISFADPRKVDGELLWPERFSARYTEELKEQLRSWGGGYAEAGQLQQRPSPRGGGLFKRKWWGFYSTSNVGFHGSRPSGCDHESPAEELPTDFDWKVISVDAAFKANATGSRVSILTIAGKGPFRYVLDNHTEHMTFKESCDAIALFAKDGTLIGGAAFRHPDCNRILIEDKANGPAIINTLRQKLSSIIPVNPEGGKESRGQAIQPAVESGHVLLPEGAHWLEDFLAELSSFPTGQNDDQVDSLSQALIYMTASLDITRAIGMANL